MAVAVAACCHSSHSHDLVREHRAALKFAAEYSEKNRWKAADRIEDMQTVSVRQVVSRLPNPAEKVVAEARPGSLEKEVSFLSVLQKRWPWCYHMKWDKVVVGSVWHVSGGRREEEAARKERKERAKLRSLSDGFQI